MLRAPSSSNSGHPLPVYTLCSPNSSSLPSFKLFKTELRAAWAMEDMGSGPLFCY